MQIVELSLSVKAFSKNPQSWLVNYCKKHIDF